MAYATRLKIFTSVAVLLVVSLLFLPAIPQDINYHNFADQDALFGLPNFWNVSSNLPFVLIGCWALVHMFTRDRQKIEPQLFIFSLIFFAGFTLTGFGSAYYHWGPDNTSLVWDRLPMTIAFMSFFAMMLSLHINQRTGLLGLFPLILTGMGSVAYWAYTEQLGRGDLRTYAGVQFIPILLIPLLIVLFPGASYKLRYFFFILTAYIGAKIFEYFDAQIFQYFPLSGHSIKHLCASLSGIGFYFLVRSSRTVNKA